MRKIIRFIVRKSEGIAAGRERGNRGGRRKEKMNLRRIHRDEVRFYERKGKRPGKEKNDVFHMATRGEDAGHRREVFVHPPVFYGRKGWGKRGGGYLSRNLKKVLETLRLTCRRKEQKLA